MNIQIGDIVLAKNRYGKTGRYIITKFGKGQATFRGVFVVSSPKETERAEDIRKLGNYGYALLKHAYRYLYQNKSNTTRNYLLPLPHTQSVGA